ncbi:MAG: 30S ribosome-binding factor RbfA [Nitrospirota bacterium]|jgi:ribosome-binding factor A
MRYSTDFSRRERLNAQLVKLLSELIQRRAKDPRIGGVTVTGADVSPDLRHARVYVSVVGDASAHELALTGLASAAPYFRTTLGKMMRVKRVPELHFRFDRSLETGAHMEELIASLDIPEAEGEDDG